MAFNFGLVAGNPFYLATLGLALIGWIITFAGSIAARLKGVIWFYIIYELFLIIGVLLSIATDTLRHHRFAFIGFLSVGVVWFTNTIDLYLGLPTPEIQAVAAGSIFLCIVMIVWIISFGSEDDSFISKIINSWALNKPRAIVGGGTDGPITLGPVQEQLSTVVVSPNADYAYKAKALYDYQANPEDQNELSLVKGEILDIVDNKGKWWQAKKADGTIGIAPSNYLQII